MDDLNKPVHIRVVLGLHNGVMYTKRGDGEWTTDFGTEANWVGDALNIRPQDWAVLHDSIVFVSERSF